jgi:hypothetical protein
MRFSDPYLGYTYDTLHRGDIGVFGNHLWPLLKDVLDRLGTLGKLSQWSVHPVEVRCFFVRFETDYISA